MIEITMPRGDIRPVRFGVFEPNGKQQSDIEFTEIYVSCKRDCLDTECLFQKTLTGGTVQRVGNGEYQFRIMPEDTNDLAFGDYDIDIEIIYYDLIKETTYGKLTLTKEVTSANNEVI